MPLIPANLQQELLDATTLAPTAEISMTKLGVSIALYIQNNTILNFSWLGFNPKGDPDPIVAPTGKILSCLITLMPSGSTVTGLGIQKLGMDITAFMKATTYNITGFGTVPGIMADIPPLNLNISGNIRELAMMQMAMQICAWMTTYVPATPCTGAHGPFIGSGNVVKIL